MRTIDTTRLTTAFYEETRAAWRTMRDRYPADDFYAFGLFTTELASYLTITASTEQGLVRSATEYAQRTAKSVAHYLTRLRWIPADSPMHAEGSVFLRRCKGIRNEGPDPYNCTEEENNAAVHAVFSSFTNAVRRLDDEGEFGVGDARERLIIGIWWGDQGDDESLALATPINSKQALDRFSREMAAAYGDA